MTIDEFKAWFDGYREGVGFPPVLDAIAGKLAEIGADDERGDRAELKIRLDDPQWQSANRVVAGGAGRVPRDPLHGDRFGELSRRHAKSFFAGMDTRTTD